MKLRFVTLLVLGTAFSAKIPKLPKAVSPLCHFSPEENFPGRNINNTIGDPNRDLILHISQESFHEGVFATGLHKFSYSYTINGMTVNFEADLRETICAKGDSYEAAGKLDFTPFTEAVLPTGDFEGKGPFDACITDARIAGSATIRVNLISEKISVTKLELTEIKFASAKVDLKNMKVNGELVPWATWSAELKADFDKEWPIHGDKFTERARQAATHFLKDYTVTELLEFLTRPPAPCS